ncbi:putative inorganic phosphate cotransporter [Anoplophora glabripennis]|uniref:putative inorganic phosphate cotransporter n=1 Tax=Anoplophora glabripennis TaxID=217634 RepID=UPI000875096D|nr:putative inorganic phosphate cotransporter [Anoplophora glabripennis]
MKGENEVEVQEPVRWFGIRHIQYVLFFTAALCAYAIRTSLNVAVIAMISSDPPSEDIPTYPEWESKQNIMLSSFFWGYLATQILAGQLAERFGPKWFLAGTYFLGSLFSILIPIFGATFGYQGVIACRVIQGLSQGFLFPCLHNMLGKWCPLEDRAKACGFAYAGAPLGTVIAMPITGLISDAENLGWPVAYYIFGAFGIAWTLVWMVVGSDCPSKNRFISASEKKYINSGLKSEVEEAGQTAPTPWLAILTSVPFWAIVINDCGESWGYWTLLTKIPSFMQNILNFDIASNSLLSALPYLAFWLLSILMGLSADFFIMKGITSVTTSRKICNSIAMFVPAVALVSLSFVSNTERALSITLLVIAVGCTGGIFCGYTVNHIDLSPNYAGTLMGMANTASNVFSLLAPLFVDAVTNATGYKETNDELWTIVFCTSAGIYVFVGIVFIFAGSGKIQRWNNPDYVNENRKCKKNCLI